MPCIFSERSDGLLMVQSMGALESSPEHFPAAKAADEVTLFKGRLNYKVSKLLTGRVIWEHFIPGSFYFPGAASYNWLQFE